MQALRGKGEENEKQAQIIADKDRLLKRQEVSTGAGFYYLVPLAGGICVQN